MPYFYDKSTGREIWLASGSELDTVTTIGFLIVLTPFALAFGIVILLISNISTHFTLSSIVYFCIPTILCIIVAIAKVTDNCIAIFLLNYLSFTTHYVYTFFYVIPRFLVYSEISSIFGWIIFTLIFIVIMFLINCLVAIINNGFINSIIAVIVSFVFFVAVLILMGLDGDFDVKKTAYCPSNKAIEIIADILNSLIEKVKILIISKIDC